MTSSNIAKLEYDEVANELHVRFKSGPIVYIYSDVAKETYETIISSPSIGSAFHHLVKKVTTNWRRHEVF